MTDDVLAIAKKRYDMAIEAESENRASARDAMDFYWGNQWPDNVRQEREQSRRPTLTINKSKPFVRQVTNDARQMRPAIKVRPVDSLSDPETAKIINGMTRAIEKSSQAENAYDWAVIHSVIGGEGYWLIDMDYEDELSFDRGLSISRILDQHSVHIDPEAQQQDGSDAKWGFIEHYMLRDDFKEAYPGVDVSDWPVSTTKEYGDWFDQDHVRVAKYWEVEDEKLTIVMAPNGQVLEKSEWDEIALGLEPVYSRETTRKRVVHRIITARDVLEEVEWPGKYIPIVRVLGEELIVGGKRRTCGMISDLMDPCRLYNYIRSAGVERVALSPLMPYIGPRGTFSDPKWGDANKKSYGFIEYEVIPGAAPPTREAPPDISPGLAHELNVASQDMMDVTGIYQPAMGDRSPEVSGVAIDSRKTESDVSNFHYLDNFAKAIQHTGRILVDLIPKVYSTERVVAILGEDGSEENVQLNTPGPYLDQRTQKPRHYQVAVGKYDVVVDIGPSYTTQREAAAKSMLEFAKAFPPAVQVIGDLLAKNMDWPQADEISDRMKSMLPPQILSKDNPQMAAIAQRFESEKQQMGQMVQLLQHELQKAQLELRDKSADAQLKQAELERKYTEMLQKHIEGMTKLEIEANKDLGTEGRAY